tara:strand:+ start:1688 stop:2845 length:1158 start_codon:yes stop_codon:yes gene_type:complete
MGRRRRRGRRTSSVKNNKVNNANKVNAAIGAGTAAANRKRSMQQVLSGVNRGVPIASGEMSDKMMNSLMIPQGMRPRATQTGEQKLRNATMNMGTNAQYNDALSRGRSPKRRKGGMGALDVAGKGGLRGIAQQFQDRNRQGSNAFSGVRGTGKGAQRPLPRRGPEGSRTRNPFARPRPERGYGMGREQRGYGMGQTGYAAKESKINRAHGMGEMDRVQELLMGRGNRPTFAQQESFVGGDQVWGRGGKGGFGGYGSMGEFGGRDPLDLGTMSEQIKPTKRKRGTRPNERGNFREIIRSKAPGLDRYDRPTRIGNVSLKWGLGGRGDSGNKYGRRFARDRFAVRRAPEQQANLQMQSFDGPNKKAGTKQGAFKLPKTIKKTKTKKS